MLTEEFKERSSNIFYPDKKKQAFLYNVANFLNKLLKITPSSSFEEKERERFLSILHFAYGVQFFGNIEMFCTNSQIAIPLFNYGLGIEAKFYEHFGEGKDSNLLDEVTKNQLFIGAKKGDLCLSRHSPGFKQAIFNVNDLKESFNQFKLVDLVRLVHVLHAAKENLSFTHNNRYKAEQMENYISKQVLSKNGIASLQKHCLLACAKIPDALAEIEVVNTGIIDSALGVKPGNK